MDKVIFLDRDGVINKCAPPHQHIKCWEDFEFLEGVPEAIVLLKAADYKIVVVTNQSCIARGTVTVEELESLHLRMKAVLREQGAVIDRILYCPHDDGQCTCRKPAPGMLLEAESDYHVDKNNSYLIGDNESDMAVGKMYGVQVIRIAPQNVKGFICCKNLLEAAKWIIEDRSRIK